MSDNQGTLNLDYASLPLKRPDLGDTLAHLTLMVMKLAAVVKMSVPETEATRQLLDEVGDEMDRTIDALEAARLLPADEGFDNGY